MSNLTVTANQESTKDTYTNKKKQFKHNTKNSHQTTRELGKEEKKPPPQSPKQLTKWQQEHTYQ